MEWERRMGGVEGGRSHGTVVLWGMVMMMMMVVVMVMVIMVVMRW